MDKAGQPLLISTEKSMKRGVVTNMLIFSSVCNAATLFRKIEKKSFVCRERVTPQVRC